MTLYNLTVDSENPGRGFFAVPDEALADSIRLMVDTYPGKVVKVRKYDGPSVAVTPARTVPDVAGRDL